VYQSESSVDHDKVTRYRSRMTRLLAFAITTLLPAAVWGTPLDLSLNIQEARLKNGLHLIVLEHHTAPIISYQSWFHVGSSDETAGKTGIAHLFEHMMFNGTKKYPQGMFDSKIEKVGGTNNAFTTRDYTGYFEEVAKENLELIVELESDRMKNLIIDPKSLEREREVVLEERKLRLDNSIFGKALQELYFKAFTTSPYRWQVIGYEGDVEGLTVEDCQEFFKTYYSPNNATIVIAGDVTFKEAYRLVKKYYGKIPSSDIPVNKFKSEPEQKKEIRSTLKLPAQTEILLIGYKLPAHGSVNEYPLGILNQILFQGASSRLERKLIYEKRLVTSISGSLELKKYPSLMLISASLHPGVNSDKVLGAIEQVIDKIQKELVTEKELQKAINQRISSRVSSMRRISGLASSLAYNQVARGDYKRLLKDLEKYQQVTRKEIRQAALQIFNPKQRTIVKVVPEK